MIWHHRSTTKRIFLPLFTTIYLTGRVDVTGFLQEAALLGILKKMLVRGEKGHEVWRTNRKRARFNEPISCFEMRLCCQQPSSWKKQLPTPSPLEMPLFCVLFAPFSPPPLRLPASRQAREPAQTCYGRFRLWAGVFWDVHPPPDVTNRTIHSEKKRSLSSCCNHKEKSCLSLMEINETGPGKTELSEWNEVRNILGRYDVSHTC